MFEPDYKKYTLDELYDAINNIDKERFPQRVEIIENEISYRNKNASINKNITIPKEELSSPPKNNVFELYKITDLKSSEKAIKKAWIAGLFTTLYLLVLTILAVINVKFIVNEYFTVYSFADVIVAGIITIGIYYKSRTFAILSVVFILSNHLYEWYKLGEFNLSFLSIVLIYFFYQGILGTFKYHKLAPKEVQSELNDEKNCPKCGTQNHVANYRCGCGYEFIQSNNGNLA